MKIRVNKFIAQSLGISRRNADRKIESGQVLVNQKIAQLGQLVDETQDEILFNGKSIKKNQQYVYYVINKPVGYVSTTFDKFAQKKVTDLVPKNPKVYPVGRLDKNSEGLMILTNDGDFSYKLTHPKFNHVKKYLITAIKIKDKNLSTNRIIARLKRGVSLKEGIAKFDDIEVLGDNINKKNERMSAIVTMHQGWKRQIRRMFDKVGFEVIKLKRIGLGKLDLKKLDINPKNFKIINPNDVI